MALAKKKRLERWKRKYKLVVLNDDTFEQKVSFTLNILQVFVAAAGGAIVLIAGTIFLIIKTPLKEYIPGYADVLLKNQVAEAANRADSLELVFLANEMYLENIQGVIQGKIKAAALDSGIRKTEAPVDLDRKPPKELQELRADLIGEERGLKEDKKKKR